jgi:metal-sulfur cluster biosynthetic enzyme
VTLQTVESDTRAAINEVLDPCSVGRNVPAGLVDMGMLRDLTVAEGPDGGVTARLELRLTSPGCTFQLYFERELRERLAAIPAIRDIQISWSRQFDWSDDDMSPNLRARLRAKQRSMLEKLATSPTGRPVGASRPSTDR